MTLNPDLLPVTPLPEDWMVNDRGEPFFEDDIHYDRILFQRDDTGQWWAQTTLYNRERHSAFVDTHVVVGPELLERLDRIAEEHR